MKRNHRFVTISSLAIAAIAVVVLWTNTTKQRKQLEEQKATVSKLTQKLASQQQLLHVDTLLVEGRYQDALEHYKNHGAGTFEDNQLGVGLRVALAQKLLAFENNLTQQLSVVDEIDGSEIPEKEAETSPMKMDQLDSLNFVLSKTKIQLAKLKRQLQKKSFGEYLTFTNGNGSQIHYVDRSKMERPMVMAWPFLIPEAVTKVNGQTTNGMDKALFIGKMGSTTKETTKVTNEMVKEPTTGPNGEKYVGQWKEDQRSGKGAFYTKDGKLMTSGIWEDDKMIAANTKGRKARSKERGAAGGL